MFEIEYERPNGNSATKQSVNYHLAVQSTFPNLTDGNSAIFLSPAIRLVRLELERKGNLRHTERTYFFVIEKFNSSMNLLWSEGKP